MPRLGMQRRCGKITQALVSNTRFLEAAQEQSRPPDIKQEPLHSSSLFTNWKGARDTHHPQANSSQATCDQSNVDIGFPPYQTDNRRENGPSPEGDQQFGRRPRTPGQRHPLPAQLLLLNHSPGTMPTIQRVLPAHHLLKFLNLLRDVDDFLSPPITGPIPQRLEGDSNPDLLGFQLPALHLHLPYGRT